MKYIVIIYLFLNGSYLMGQSLPDHQELPTDSLDWIYWNQEQWESQVEKDRYKKKNIDPTQDQAYEYGKQHGITMPSRHGIYTYDPQTDTLIRESDEDYSNRLNSWIDQYLLSAAQPVIIEASLAWLQ